MHSDATLSGPLSSVVGQHCQTKLSLSGDHSSELGCGRIDPSSVHPGWLDAPNGRGWAPPAAVSRLGDILTSAVLLLGAAPLMLLVALLVRLDSRGPSLYRQVRLGLNGRAFTVLKFRSMRTDAEAAGPTWATVKDPRITRVGNFIRRTRIDELPQLINVLRGEMAVIGPRPERPHFIDSLSAEIPNFRERLVVKPGLTGWAQVNFRYGASIEDARTKLSYDLYYVRNRSALLDLRILLATIRVVLFQEGSR